jgi:methylmalonyl-CoA/ethylmalonyl-CoA epimerase
VVNFPRSFHHIGLACRAIETEVNGLAALGYVSEGPPVEDPIQKVRVQFWRAGGGPRIELIEPTSVDSPVQNLLKRGTKFYHLAYEVPAFDDAIRLLEIEKFRAVGPAAPVRAFAMRRIIFMVSDALTLVELIEAPGLQSG